MPSIIVYLDDSAEERRRRRRRILGGIILLLALLGIAAARPTTQGPKEVEKRVEVPVPVPVYISTDTQGPYQPPPAPITPAQRDSEQGGGRDELEQKKHDVSDPTFVFGKFPVTTPWTDVTIVVERQKVLTAQVAPRHIHFIRPGSKRVIVSNPNDEPIHVNRIVLEGVGYELKGDEKCRTLLNPGQSCTFSVVAKLVSGYTSPARLTIE